jgi:hypothetical protein
MAGSPEIKERGRQPASPDPGRGGPSRAGYYFSVTDKTWKPGSEDYHYMTQGALVVGNVAVEFHLPVQ